MRFPFDKRFRPGTRTSHDYNHHRRMARRQRDRSETSKSTSGPAELQGDPDESHWDGIDGNGAITGVAPAADEPPPEKMGARLLKLHRDEAPVEIFVDASRTKKAKFVPSRSIDGRTRPANGQIGAMFVWTFEGRPVALGGVFSNPEAGRRVIMHEFHALGPLRIVPGN